MDELVNVDFCSFLYALTTHDNQSLEILGFNHGMLKSDLFQKWRYSTQSATNSSPQLLSTSCLVDFV
jgi:hypothetical protein